MRRSRSVPLSSCGLPARNCLTILLVSVKCRGLFFSREFNYFLIRTRLMRVFQVSFGVLCFLLSIFTFDIMRGKDFIHKTFFHT